MRLLKGELINGVCPFLLHNKQGHTVFFFLGNITV